MSQDVIITVQSKRNGGAPWEEKYTIDDGVDAKKWADDTIKYFNSTLRPGESLRKVVSVKVIKDGRLGEHQWEKMMYGLQDNGGIYDTYRCKRCLVTGKRRGISEIVIDGKFRAKRFKDCDWMQPTPKEANNPADRREKGETNGKEGV